MSTLKKILSVFLCAALLSTAGCAVVQNSPADSQNSVSVSEESDKESGEDSGEESGKEEEPIVPTEPTEYAREIKEEAERIAVTVSERAFSAEGVSLTAAQKEKIISYTEEYVVPVFEREGVTELKFYSVIKSIESRGEVAVAAVLSLYGEKNLTGEQYREVLALYADFAGYLGGVKMAELIYELAIERYNFQIAEYVSKYERTGYGFYLDYIAEEEENKRILTEEIGRNNFSALVKVVMELLNDMDGIFSEKEEVTDGAAYTDLEILSLLALSGYQLRDLDITEQGWGACLRFAGKYLDKSLSKDAGMGLRTAALLCTEDYAALGRVSGNAAALFSSGAMNLEEKDIALLKQKDFTGLFSVVCSRFTAAEWEELESVFSAELQSEKYLALLESQGYKEEYRSYCAVTQTATVEELRAAAGTSAFSLLLEEYIFGKIPYLAFILFR